MRFKLGAFSAAKTEHGTIGTQGQIFFKAKSDIFPLSKVSIKNYLKFLGKLKALKILGTKSFHKPDVHLFFLSFKSYTLRDRYEAAETGNIGV